MKLGIFVKCPHPEIIEVLGIAGIDFAFVDMEHTPLGPRDLYPLVLAAERRGLRLVVRIPENTPHWFKWALDLGVSEIQVPDVRSAKDAVRAREASTFPPRGKRGLCRFTRAANFSSMPQADYLNASAYRTQLIFQVEHFENFLPRQDGNSVNKAGAEGQRMRTVPSDDGTTLVSTTSCKSTSTRLAPMVVEAASSRVICAMALGIASRSPLVRKSAVEV